MTRAFADSMVRKTQFVASGLKYNYGKLRVKIFVTYFVKVHPLSLHLCAFVFTCPV